ncbi:MAG TPA: UTP--glucose-1-phosphate uridylyltransferase GalU [Bacillus sp. (in: firmicutes)]|uniref:UTP--glucose-1-phosphate uridylyltransferase GalU n=1 Tax=Bacillus litorisediminis TaxID=2922713 RepID=UPI001FAE5CA4|nr:UTP--glucose-1-phosphate uridylyltransferase GalU [Bacillus litorisediminis]HWO75797.1 UTP--glucose-1-phosphate uridylyltransferase GalU [Bacillus sp. (in: firmicutes)]
MIKKAVIPAAGLGTRFLPATKAQPKEMLPIVDKPAIQYIIEEAVASGIEDIIIVTGRNKRAIEDHFDKSVELELILQKTSKHEVYEMVKQISNLAQIHYVRQKEPLGLGDAVFCARKFIGDEPFAVLLGDDIIDSDVPALKQMIQQFEIAGKSILGCEDVPRHDVSKYGIVQYSHKIGDLYGVLNLIEKPSVEEAPSTLAIVGRYILTPAVFEQIEWVKPDRNGEIQLTEAIDRLVEIEPVHSYLIQGKRYDVGDKFGFLKATIDFALKNPGLKEQLIRYIRENVR